MPADDTLRDAERALRLARAREIFEGEIARLTDERDAARAEATTLRAALNEALDEIVRTGEDEGARDVEHDPFVQKMRAIARAP